jgi:hypothetical protein
MSASPTHAPWQAPLQWPDMADASSVERRAQQAQRLLKVAFVVALLSLTVLDRFGLRLGQYSAHPALFALYGLVTLALLTGAAELNARGALHYVAVACVAGLSYLVNASVGSSQYVSIASWLLLMVLYAPFIVSLRQGAASASLWRWVTKMYMGFTLFIAAAGIAQFSVQFVFHPTWLFNYTLLIPEPVRAFEVWVTVHSVGDWFKSNGFFLREPSFFSMQMGFGLLVELSLARRKWVMAILILGIAYKRDIDDIRESPAAEIIELLWDGGATVAYHDPHVPKFPPMRKYKIGLSSVALDAKTLAEHDCVLIVTNHAAVDYATIGDHASLVVDTRNAMSTVQSPRAEVVSHSC